MILYENTDKHMMVMYRAALSEWKLHPDLTFQILCVHVSQLCFVTYLIPEDKEPVGVAHDDCFHSDYTFLQGLIDFPLQAKGEEDIVFLWLCLLSPGGQIRVCVLCQMSVFDLCFIFSNQFLVVLCRTCFPCFRSGIESLWNLSTRLPPSTNGRSHSVCQYFAPISCSV